EAEAESEGEFAFTCKGGGDGATELAALGAGEVRAGRVTDAAQLLGGDSRDGKVGDFKLYNDRVAFIIQSERDGDNYVPYGGALIDADLVRSGDEWGEDRIDEYATAFLFNAFAADDVCVVSDGSDGEDAVVRAVGHDALISLVAGFGLSPQPWNLQVMNEYRLRPGASYLEVTTTAVSPDDATIETGDFILMSDDGFDPWVLGPGFERGGDVDDLIMMGIAGEDQHMAYGFFADGPLGTQQAIAGAVQNLAANDLSLFFPTRAIEYAAGVPGTHRRFVALGRDIDDLNRARLEALAREGTATISGTVTAGDLPVEGARVHFVEDDAGYASMARTDAKGRYEAALPAGSYTVTATGSDIGQEVEVPVRPPPAGVFAHGFGKSAPGSATVVAGGKATVELELTKPGRLSVDVENVDGDPTPAKLTIAFSSGSDPTPPDPMLGERDPYAPFERVLWSTDGSFEADVPPGTYDLTASRGAEHELATAGPVVVESGVTTDLTLALIDVVDSSGWMQGDMHMHGGPSLHGEVTMEQRIVTNIAEGLDFFISSDHDRVIDYQPTIDRIGLGDLQMSYTSDEISTFALGHFNPYPLTVDENASNGGAVPWWDGLTPQQIFDAARAHGAQVVQINHGFGTGGYFTATDYDFASGKGGEDFTLDFDAMETHNGKGGPNEGLFSTYMSLLDHGKRVAPTGVSDSHHRIPEAGFARTYVKLMAGGPADIDTDDFVAAMLGAATIVTTGPFIRFTAETDSGPGDTVTVDDGMVTLHVEVLAPSWVPVERVRVFGGGGSEVMEWGTEELPLDPAPPVWLDEVIEVAVTANTWFLVRVDGPADQDLAPVAPGALVYAHTAAIFVEVEK
ncbi:MAG: CehA/McbA family metallohydrolase, partial [Myxococcota bacterium]